MSRRLLILSTYPAINPQHGGQKRTLALAKAYRDSGFEVLQSAVFCGSHYAHFSVTDIPLSMSFEKLIARSPFTGDVLCGRAMVEDIPVRRTLERMLRTFRPDAVHVEQPYLYPGLRRLLIELGLDPVIVYGSQNIEAPMKESILADAGWAPRHVRRYCAEIHALEVMFSRECDLLAACTPADREQHEAFGARSTVLAPNGIESVTEKAAGLEDLSIAAELASTRSVVFIGSAHRPNLVGFRDLLGSELGFLPADGRLVAVGGICTSIKNSLRDSGPPDPKLLLAGRVSEPQLRDLIEHAEIIVLPITIGGGSNLKTAEAIAANRKVVTSSAALRSYEWFADFPNVWVADTMTEFHAAIGAALEAEYISRTVEQERTVSSIYWEQCLGDLVTAVGDLVSRASDRGER